MIGADRWREIDRVFAEALDRPLAERQAYLDGACAGDSELREAVERLLQADEASDTFLERPASELLGLLPEVEPGERLGPYRLLRRLGAGGMGTVYLARREDEHYQQDVALKILRSGLQGTEAVHRFLAERQILARLEHPNIARLYDGGSTPDGRPYLVMELVEGLPVDDYCDRHQLAVDQRLDLFRRICSAVQYAHQHLLVHRDLKPANILVTEEGEPKLLDFGIAKRLEPGSATKPDLTQTGSRVMTPSYASPEQVRGEAITTASDVYSLGVLLYELLSGRTPYRVERALVHEIERAICEAEPERPSAALFRAGEPSAEEIARARNTRPLALARRLRGDLDNIALMALRKEPARRYGSASQLSRDVENHLHSLPVVARPDTLSYRTRKFVRRHRFGVSAAALVVLLVAGFIASLIVQGRRIARERDKAQYSLSFLLDTFKDADPYHTKGEHLTADEILSRGAERVSRDLSGRPDVQAALMDAIGEVERGLGRYDRAEPLLERGLALRQTTFGPDSLEAAESLKHLGQLKRERSAFAEAERLLRQSLAIERARLGDGSLETASTLNELGDLLASNNGKAVEAEELHREAWKIATRVEGAVGPTVAESLLYLSQAKLAQGNKVAAERIAREALVVEKGVLGRRDPRFYRVQSQVADVLIQAGKYKEAEKLLRDSLSAQWGILGKRHPDVSLTLHSLAYTLHREGSWAAAEGMNRELLEMVRAQFGPAHPLIDETLINLGTDIDAQGRPAEALPYYLRALEIRRGKFPGDSAQVAQALLLAAGAYRGLKQYPRAISFSGQALEILEKVHDPHVDFALREIGRDYLGEGSPAEAEPYLRRALALRRESLGRDHPDLATAKFTLADCLVDLGRYDEAEALLREARASLKRHAEDNQDRLGQVADIEAKLRRRRG
ncbi:MAG TPA: serine/threonine-protein kinase [Thermoanaerobaculia bacterium]|nr:serine/threonine-protein kinase [Thermoanaerobaculia bacterium]